MAYSLRLPRQISRQWAVKIRDRERVEPPYATILKGSQAWRVNLRTGEFMDKQPDPDKVPDAVMDALETHWAELCAKWDELYPNNPIAPVEANDE